MIYQDLTGEAYGRLTVIKKAGHDAHGNTMWECLCECNQTKIVKTADLKNGKTKSCGCFQRERASESHTKHGKRHTRLYNIWSNMKGRCHTKSCSFYEKYGGRGITVCDEWSNSFDSFWTWAMANGYRDDLTIDRIDNDGNYCPENCRWVTPKENARNRPCTVTITVDGITKTRSEWAEFIGMKPETLRSAIRRGHDPEEYIKKHLKGGQTK